MLLISSSVVFAHGTQYEIIQPKEISVKSSFGTGVPMANCDVLIFYPSSTKIDMKTRTNNDGIFSFIPDKAGIWSIQVRDKSGHGMRINLEIDEQFKLKSDNSTNNGISYIQKIIMAICVIWGFVGTALFFKRRKA